MGLWVLDRELASSRPEWLGVFRTALLAIPLLVVLLWMSPTLSSDAVLFDIPERIQRQLSRHVGSNLLRGLNPNKLIATHAFLELIHYGVWIVAIPLASRRTVLSSVEGMPLARRSGRTRTLLRALVLFAAFVVLLLWGAFTIDYATTRDIYFTVATAHVLAEVPFLLRLL